MNRRPANALDSDDSESDWDTTVAESPTSHQPPKLSAPSFREDVEGDYATVTPKPRSTLKEADGSSSQRDQSERLPLPTPRKDNTQSKPSVPMTSPPPHMSSFQNALSDYTPVYETSPDIPARGYEGKGKLYTVPESPQTNTVNWDDSDADERVLKEIQTNLERDKQRQQQQQQQAAGRDKKVVIVTGDKSSSSADNHGYMPSPVLSRSNESTLEKWTRANEASQGRSSHPGKILEGRSKSPMVTDISDPSFFRPPSRSALTPPLGVKADPATKSIIYYFEEGNPHFVHVEPEDVDAVLPEKIEDVEKMIRRVWREVFSVLRVVTSFFVIFVSELIHFLVHHVTRPLVLDSIATVSDYVIKPILTLIFNGIVQPTFSFLWNTFSALYRALDPIGRILGFFLTQVAIVVKAFRLVTIEYTRPVRYNGDVEVV